MRILELRAELEKNHGSSFGWAMSCCGRDRYEAEEVLQTVYLKVLEGKARFCGQSSFKTWLFAVIRKTAANERRKNLFRRLKSAADPQRLAANRVSNDAPEVALELSETRSRFAQALRRLPARQRETLHLVFYEDLTLREAAVVLGISIGAVRTHYERGKKRLRALMNKTEREHAVEWRGEENPGVVL